MLPPSASMASTISRAERDPAPLKTICSRRCDQPQRAASSARAPRPATTDSATVCRPGIGSQTTRTPLLRVWTLGVMSLPLREGADVGLDGLGLRRQAVEAFGAADQVGDAAGQLRRDAAGLGHGL